MSAADNRRLTRRLPTSGGAQRRGTPVDSVGCRTVDGDRRFAAPIPHLAPADLRRRVAAMRGLQMSDDRRGPFFVRWHPSPPTTQAGFSRERAERMFDELPE